MYEIMIELKTKDQNNKIRQYGICRDKITTE